MKFRGMTVEVTDAYRQRFPEWDVFQNFHDNTSDCFIRSESSKQFFIRIKPDLPFPFKPPRPAPLIPNVPVSFNFNGNDTGTGFVGGKPPWSYLATVRVDGRLEPERKTIISLDAINVFRAGQGEVVLTGRTILRRGSYRHLGWIFEASDKPHKHDKDHALKHLTSLALDDASSETDNAAETRRGEEAATFPGIIEITLERVTIGAARLEEDVLTTSTSIEGSPLRTNGKKASVKHVVGRGGARGGLGPRKAPWPIEYQHLNDTDGPGFIKFIFKYKSDAELALIGVPGFVPAPSSAAAATAAPLGALLPGLGGNLHAPVLPLTRPPPPFRRATTAPTISGAAAPPPPPPQPRTFTLSVRTKLPPKRAAEEEEEEVAVKAEEGEEDEERECGGEAARHYKKARFG